MGDSNAILLGRRTYQMFAPAWSTRTVDDDPGAPFFNDTDKYVVSSTLTTTEWQNSSILGPYDPAAIERLKADVEGTVYVSGSAMFRTAQPASGSPWSRPTSMRTAWCTSGTPRRRMNSS